MPLTHDAEIVAPDIATFTGLVRQTEDAGATFADSRVLIADGEPVNRATFTLLPLGQLPTTEPVFVKLAELPAGQAAAWTGVLVLDGRNTAAHMFRQALTGEPA